MLVRCKHDELVKVDILIGKKHPKNANTHPKEQITRLAKIMAYQGVRHPITISKLSGLITKGHGRLAAAVVNGWTEFPVEYQDYDDQDMEVADVHADNEIARWAELDLEFLKGQLPDFKEGFDFDVLGLRSLDDPNFLPGTEDDQGKLDEKKPVECPNCGHQFTT